jgi:hypothetical protein
MLRNISKTVGSVMAALCLVSTLAMAQAQYPAQSLPSSEKAGMSQRQTQTPPSGYPMMLTCTKDNGKGNCIAAAGADGKEIVVVGEGLEKGATMSCVDRGNIVDCKPAT